MLTLKMTPPPTPPTLKELSNICLSQRGQAKTSPPRDILSASPGAAHIETINLTTLFTVVYVSNLVLTIWILQTFIRKCRSGILSISPNYLFTSLPVGVHDTLKCKDFLFIYFVWLTYTNLSNASINSSRATHLCSLRPKLPLPPPPSPTPRVKFIIVSDPVSLDKGTQH